MSQFASASQCSTKRSRGLHSCLGSLPATCRRRRPGQAPRPNGGWHEIFPGSEEATKCFSLRHS